MKISTKKGDKGETFLFTGKKVTKNHPRIICLGAIDELNSLLGVAKTHFPEGEIKKILHQIQKDLFLLGSSLAGLEVETQLFSRRIWEMENWIEKKEKKLPPLSGFLLPGGVKEAAFLYLVRAVVRRVEREVVALSCQEKVKKEILVYLNRLSDFLFLLARQVNLAAGFQEESWSGKKFLRKRKDHSF